MESPNISDDSYTQDGPVAREIASVIPYFPFKGIPRFYDISGFLSKPEVFQRVVDVFASRYSNDKAIDAVVGYVYTACEYLPIWKDSTSFRFLWRHI